MRSKFWLIAGIVLVAASALFGATQTWVVLDLAEGAAVVARLEATGQQLNASLSSIALAALAGAVALTIAGRGFRRVLGGLIVLFGAGIVAIAIAVLNDPEGAASGRLAEVSGIAGHAQLDLVTAIGTTPYIAFALSAGLLLALLGVLVLVLGGRWKTAGRKYSAHAEQKADSSDSGASGAGGAEGAGGAARAEDEPDRFSDWDRLSEGEDPSEPR